MADVQIAVIDQQNTEVTVAVPGIQGIQGQTGDVAVAQDGTAGTPGIRFENDTNTGIYRPGPDQLALSTNGTGRLFVDASGNVGVNTASPSSVFNIDAGSSRLSIDHASASAIELKRSSTGSETRISLSNIADSKAAQIRVNWAGQSFGAFESWVPNNTSNGQTIVFQAGTDNTIVYGGTAGIERLRITSAGLVGIGTSAPSNLLHLYESGTTQTASSDSQLVIEKNNNSGISILSRNVLSGHIYFGDSGDNDVGQITYNHSSNYMQFTTNGSETIRIDSAGRLLVGTSSDSGGALLQVNGNRIRVATAKTPASASDTGTTGEICWDANYVYVCTATNTWKRSALSTW